MKQLKIGIIGIGNMGSYHAARIREGSCPEMTLTAVADIAPNRRAWAKEAMPEVAVFDTAEEMLDSGLVEAVIVAVPHYNHPTYAMACFRRGLHVMVEKPAGVYTRQVREMNEASRNAGVVFGMMFNQRTNPVYRKMREIVQSGTLGQIRRTNWIITDWYRTQAYYDSGSWRATWSGEGGGVLLNQCPHNLDLWQWICGMPVKILAKMSFGKWHNIEVEDDVTILAEYENGATGTFVTSTGDTPGRNRFEIVLDGGNLLVENNTLTVTRLEVSEPIFSATCKESFASPPNTVQTLQIDEEYPRHVGVLNRFASAVLHGTDLVANGVEGINGLMISNAAHLSAWLRQEVALPIDEDLFYEELMKRVATSRRKTASVSHAADMAGSFGS